MSKSLLSIYNQLYACYGDLCWWPAETHYEVMVGAVLTQNTAWSNVEKAIGNFKGQLSPEFVQGCALDQLIEIIYPAGFYVRKAQCLKDLTNWYAGYGWDRDCVSAFPLEKVRGELLSIRGIGQETADSILLYAFGSETFVVDAYTQRLCSRFPLEAGHDYASTKAYFESNFEKSETIYNNFHAMIVMNAKEHCRKKPLCSGCPLALTCGRRMD